MDARVIDLDVRVTPDGEGFRAVVRCDAIDSGTSGAFVPPVSVEALEAFAAGLRSAQGRHVRPAGAQVLDVQDQADAIGRALFEGLFDRDAVRVLTRAQDEARDAGALLRLRLMLDDAPSVARLPWELLLDGSRYLVHTADEFVVRYADLDRPPPRVRRGDRLRVLVVAATPQGLTRLDVDREHAGLVQALAPLADDVELHRLERPTLPALREALEQEWHVLHVIGHGEVRDDGGVMVLEHADGSPDEVDAAVLGRLVAGSPTLRLAVLNGCSTAALPLHRPQAGVAQALVRSGVAAAVAMQFPITDRGAIEFAAGLYEGLARGDLVDQAVARGRRRLLRGPEWVTPVLVTRTGARLFEPPPAEPDTAPSVRPPLRPRDRVPHGTVPAVLQPRGWVVDEVADWLASDARLLLLTGAHGTGKSVLAAWLAGQDPEEPVGADLPDDVRSRLEAVRERWDAVLVSTAALAGGSMDPRSFVRELAEQLAATVPRWPTGTDPADASLSHLSVRELYQVLLAQPLAAALAEPGARPVLVVVDGLDEAGAGPEPTTLALLAALAELTVPGTSVPGTSVPGTSVPGAPVRMLLAGPDDGALVRPFHAVRDLRRLDLSRAEHRAQVDEDVRAFLTRRLAGHGVAADVVDQVTRTAAGNFLVAHHAAEQLRAEPTTTLEDLELPGDLDESYDQHVRRVLERVHGDAWTAQWEATVEPLLGVLAVARAPVARAALAREALLTWLGWSVPRLSVVLDQLGQLVVCDGEGCRLTHPALGAMLRRPTLASGRPNGLLVDVRAAHRRVVEGAAALDDAALARPDDVGGAYPLVHAPWHLAQLRASGGADEALGGRLVARVVTPAWAQALAASVTDPVLVGLPYRDVLGELVAREDGAAVEHLVGVLAATDVPVLRGAVFEVLTAYVANRPTAARDFLVRLATGGEPELRAIALHATCLLTPEDQAAAFRAIVTTPRKDADVGWTGLVRRVARGDEPPDALGRAAAFALHANGTADPQHLIRAVLGSLIADVSLRPGALPASFAVAELFGRVTVTNYVNGCSDPSVAQLTSDLWKALLVGRLGLSKDPGLAERVLVQPAIVHVLSRRIQSLFTTDDGDAATGPRTPGADAARRVVPALDPAVPLEPLEAELRELLASDVTLFRILAALVVGVHAMVPISGAEAPGAVEPLVRRLADGALGADARARRWLLLAHAVVLPEAPARWVPLLEDLTRAVLAEPEQDADEPGPLQGLHLALVPLGLAYARAGRAPTVHAEVLAGTADPSDPRRTCCLAALGAVGLYHPDAVLDAFGAFDDDGTLPLADAVPALVLVAAVHPLRTRAWLLARGERGVLDAVSGGVEVQGAQRYLELLGMYANGVHQSLHYPRMRTGLCASVFTLFLEARSPKDWARRYTDAGLRMLREAEYELIRWTRP